MRENIPTSDDIMIDSSMIVWRQYERCLPIWLAHMDYANWYIHNFINSLSLYSHMEATTNLLKQRKESIVCFVLVHMYRYNLTNLYLPFHLVDLILKFKYIHATYHTIVPLNICRYMSYMKSI